METSINLDPLPPSREIPSAFTSSVRSWWHVGEKESAIAEERLLRRLPFYRPSTPASSPPSTPVDGPVTATSSRVQLSNQQHYLNTVSITSTSPSSTAPPPAVLLHGYGAGLGFYFQNLPTLANWAALRSSAVYALDWLGMGRSARVPFNVKAKREDVPGRVAEAESFFVDSLEEWREKMRLNKVTLIGHSLGAYLSVAYALKHPTRVDKLILLSPAGVPRGPNYEEPSRELTDQGPGVQHPSGSKDGSKESSTFHRATKGKVNKIQEEQKENKQKESKTRRLFTYLWEEGWSPFQVVRSTFFWGPMLIGKYSSRRFTGLTPEETRDMHDYIMNITLAKGSGEYCISHILEPGAHARMPLVDRIDKLPKDIRVTFVYGDHDWMDPTGGYEAVQRLKKAGNQNARMYIVDNAGHHVYLDNKDTVNDLLMQELES
ncbi:hypothetical protein NLJ89_g8167 [Agrocybe chaxingu]|uniref:AB hydrolase-1 domain-containing protein n=1 Tax=Agrocybe chaxingu TaxID=84603 RepID=A0A9W8MUC8_9AGAR|nr:hypothetical protein NLJ89_g8167 [Agrocybe chaxingu]